jgi:hypothetical protein
VGSVQHGVSHVRHSGLVAILEERLRAELRARLRLLVVLQLGLETDLKQIQNNYYYLCGISFYYFFIFCIFTFLGRGECELVVIEFTDQTFIYILCGQVQNSGPFKVSSPTMDKEMTEPSMFKTNF